MSDLNNWLGSVYKIFAIEFLKPDISGVSWNVLFFGQAYKGIIFIVLHKVGLEIF